ncbi:MAG TPA: GntG family PLP-dependent aldolase [Longimicrobiales bacterium]|nr:GntG family PLP-dependent aldolase [Longimicrobiales bacterium]
MIDIRSDTVTRPTAAMRQAMANAEVGDDVLGDDPTVARLQERAAELLGKEAAVFVPTGTMANLCAIRAQTEPGDEIIAHEQSHFFLYETGGFAAVAGCSIHTVPGARGIFSADVVDAAVRPVAVHFPRTRLVIVENTHNRGGGSVWPLGAVEAVTSAARAHGLRCHMDGARLLNACISAGVEPTAYTRHFDTVSLCFSKGLGAPAGSVIAGDAETMARVHRFRKMIGGVMRQSGILAAAALYALDHHVERLAEDHANARRFAAAIAEAPGISVDLAGVESNMVFFDVPADRVSAARFSDELGRRGVRVMPVGPRTIRAVFHLDVSAEEARRAATIVAETAAALGLATGSLR